MSYKYAIVHFTDHGYESFLSFDDEFYLPKLFVQVNIVVSKDSKYQTKYEMIAICSKFDYRDDIDCKKFYLHNRMIFQLNVNQYHCVFVDNIKFPVIMVHLCFLNREQVLKCFGNDYNGDGLCHKSNFRILHNCNKNRFFALHPFVGRNVDLLYSWFDKY